MTSKVIKNLLTISIRPQNDIEKLALENIKANLDSGKEPQIHFDGTDMILEIKSKKRLLTEVKK